MPRLVIEPVPFDEAIVMARRRRVVLPEVYYGQLQGVARMLAFSVAGMAAVEQLQAVLDSLNEALAQGQSMGAWKRRVRDGEVPLDLPEHRLDLVFRTNLQGAYNAGRWRRHWANRDRKPYLLYDAVNDARTRPSHAALDGTILPVDHPAWNTIYPPNGYNCRCKAVALTAKQARARGGPSKGLPHDGAPDPGWEYNPGVDPTGAVQRAERRTQALAHPALADAARRRPAVRQPPVSEVIRPPTRGWLAEVAREVLRAIDGLHATRAFGPVPVRTSRTLRMEAAYVLRGHTSGHVLVSRYAATPHMALVHEIGHVLDAQAVGRAGRFESAAGNPLFEAWADAVGRSRALGALRAAPQARTTRYLLQPKELWARSYAQWVAMRADSLALRSELERLRATQRVDGTFWDDEDFMPVAEAIERLLRTLGWM